MHVAGIVLGCMLLGQASGHHPVRPPEMVAEAILLPAGGSLTGKPLGLPAVLAATADRRQQLECVQAYWRLAQAVAEYRFCFNRVQGLGQVKARGGDEATLQSGLAAAAGQLREAENEAVRAQRELAHGLRLPAGSPLPLPADCPHVGAYRTMFKELFAAQTPPEPLRLTEKILPLQRQVVDDQAAAVQAAEDALAAVVEDYQTGRASSAALISCSEQLLVQQRAFIRSVCAYNRNIAGYGLAVMPLETASETLAAVLIGPPRPTAVPAAAGSERSVQPAGATEPITGNSQPQPPQSEPTPAAPRSRYESTPPPPRGGWRSSEPTPASPREPTPSKPADIPETRRVPVDSGTSSHPDSPSAPSEPRTTNKFAVPPQDAQREAAQDGETRRRGDKETSGQWSVVSGQSRYSPLTPPLSSSNPQSPIPNPSSTAPLAPPMYPALVDASPAVRAKQLTIALHWNRSLPEGQGKPISLMDCLLRDAGGDRQKTIAAYWLVGQRAAQHQLLLQQAEFLEALVPAVLDRRSEPSGAADGLRLQAVQLAAKAAAGETQVALVEAQYALALRIGAAADPLWPLASTIPHSGSYQLRLDDQPRGLAELPPVRRLAIAVPTLGENVRQRATAVVEADQARVVAAEKYRAGAAAIDQAIDAVGGQTQQTAAFLDSLAEYNGAIAEYALAVLPPATPADKLAASLVVRP